MEKSNRGNINDEVRRTMALLDTVQRVDGNPYLYTRLQARLRETKPAPASSVLRPVPAYLFAGLLLALNLWVVVTRIDEQVDSRLTGVEALADDYGLNQGNVFYPEFNQ